MLRPRAITLPPASLLPRSLHEVVALVLGAPGREPGQERVEQLGGDKRPRLDDRDQSALGPQDGHQRVAKLTMAGTADLLARHDVAGGDLLGIAHVVDAE